MRVACTALALAGLSMWPAATNAQTVLTLADVMARARERAPQVASARLAVEEARARLAGASLRLTSNPDLDFSLGARDGIERSTDLELGFNQQFDARGRRDARIEGATAVVDQAAANVDRTLREVLRVAVAAFHRAVFAGARLRLLDESQALAGSVLETADRRHRAGELAILDVNLARASLARVRADRESAEADRWAALGTLRAVLGLAEAVSVQGNLDIGPPPDAAALAAAVGQRPEFRALESAIREAEAEGRLGQTYSRATYGFVARYEREAGDRIVFGGLTLTLPVFSKGQEQRAAGFARATRLRAELEAARSRTRIELETALATYERRVAAVRVLEADALPGMNDNDALTTRSFEVGQIGLADVLLIRRETVEIRLQHLSVLLEAALARIDVDATAAVLR